MSTKDNDHPKKQNTSIDNTEPWGDEVPNNERPTFTLDPHAQIWEDEQYSPIKIIIINNQLLHQQEQTQTQKLRMMLHFIFKVCGLTAFAAIALAIIGALLIWPGAADITIKLAGQTIQSTSVGIASIALSTILIGSTVKRALKTTNEIIKKQTY